MSRTLSLKQTAALLVAAGMCSVPVEAITVAEQYDDVYTAIDLGSVGGVPGPYGGLTLLAGDSNTLLLGGSANNSNGAIYAVGVTRDVDGHITGFSGPATFYATAPNIDGGLAYGPGGVLFFTGYSNNTLGQLEPGSVVPDRIDGLTTAGVASSVGGLAFVPNDGRPGAGQFKLVSYSASRWYTASLSPDGAGTYEVTGVSSALQIEGGPEGIAYVPLGSDLFPNESVLISEYGAGKVAAYDTDSNGDPIPATRRDFVTGLSGAEGAFIDPVTGDFLFSTFGGGNKVVVVRGFAAPEPTPTPETGGTMLLLLVGAGICGMAINRAKAA